MRLIVITAPQPVSEEADTINGLFHEGLELLHLRKPGYTLKEMRTLAEAIDPDFRHRVVLHSHHQLAMELGLGGCHFPAARRQDMVRTDTRLSSSCHSPGEIEELAPVCDYLFLSPVFDSISKPGYRAAFNQATLDQLTGRHCNLVALGGIDRFTLPRLLGHNWYGAAVLGTIWNAPTLSGRLTEFQELQKAVNKRNTA